MSLGQLSRTAASLLHTDMQPGQVARNGEDRGPRPGPCAAPGDRAAQQAAPQGNTEDIQVEQQARARAAACSVRGPHCTVPPPLSQIRGYPVPDTLLGTLGVLSDTTLTTSL